MRHTGRASAKLHPASLPGGPLDPQPLRVAKIPVSSRLFTIAIRSAARTWPSHHHAAPSSNENSVVRRHGLSGAVPRTTKPPAAPDDRSPLRPHRRRSIRRHQRPATARNGVQMSQSCGPNRMATSGSATANGCTRLGRRLELVTHQRARCAYATFTFTFDFTDVSRSQTSTAPSRLSAPRTARRIRFGSAPGPEAGERE